MAIKDKDGNVYKLRGPNPLVESKAEWDKSKIKLINFGWSSEVVEDKRKPLNEVKTKPKPEVRSEPPETKVIKAMDFVNEIASISKEPPKVLVEEPKPPKREEPQVVELEIEIVQPKREVVLEVGSKLARILAERGAEYYCAPAVGKKTQEDSDGEPFETTIYGEPFVFDAIVIDQSDLQFQFWCAKQVPKGSIVHKKGNERGERSWRVDRVEPKTGGHLILSSISDLNPDFS